MLVDSMAEGLTLVNDLEWDSSRRVVYFTHSGRFPRNQIHRNLIEARPTGSVYKFDVDERRLSMLVSGLVSLLFSQKYNLAHQTYNSINTQHRL